MKSQIKVGVCVAYDWYLLEYSIPPIYQLADTICLSVDKDRISWSGNPFSWDEEGFRRLIKRLDVDNKIQVLEEDYHLPDLQPMENEVRQRNKIAAFLGDKAWHIQLDSDEFFINFEKFVHTLHSIHTKRPVNVSCPWITLYKQDKDGFYYVKPDKFEQIEFIQIATRHPHYEYGRRNGNFNILTGCALLHLSWARSEAEIWEKLNNWGHKNDFDTAAYFERWKKLSRENYTTYKDFHHVKAELWPKLEYIKAQSIEDLIETCSKTLTLPITTGQLRKSNSIWFSRLKKLMKR